MAKTPRGSARIASELPLGVQEASGVAYIGHDTFLVVDDEHGVFRCVPDGEAEALGAAKGLADLEGICVDAALERAWVLAERDGSVWQSSLSEGELSSPKRLGKLPRLNGKKNTGWEGIAFAPAGTFSSCDELLAVHQRSPRQVAFFDATTLRPRCELSLPKSARKVLGDLNDVTVRPADGHVFVLSGKKGQLCELRVEEDELVLVRTYPIATEKDDVPEGVTFSSDGRLFIVTDGEGMLREMQLNA